MQLISIPVQTRRSVAAALFAGLSAALPLAGQAADTEPSFTTLHNFSVDGSAKSGGAAPTSGLVQAPNGSFYGVAPQGGKYGLGALYVMTATGRVRTLVSFDPTTGTAPAGPLTLASDGHLYGVASAGGNCEDCGTIFRLKSNGKFQVLHRFTKASDGSRPNGGLLEADDGNLYGTASTGATYGWGSIFRIAPSGDFAVQFAFQAHPPLAYEPRSGLIQASDGFMYGTTRWGGLGDVGTVYRVDKAGSLQTLYSFSKSDGGGPTNGVIEGEDGLLYGTNPWYGPYHNTEYASGTVYRVSKTGQYELLVAMKGDTGEYPYAGLLLAADGNFYGVNNSQGADRKGTLFRLTPDGAFSLLHTFDGSDGAFSKATLIQGADGALYGTTSGGGSSDAGTAFRIVP